MKATGIVRRIDDLGRVVIPKEVRRTLKLREGDPMEIFLDDGGVCFKKYAPYNEKDWERAKKILAPIVDNFAILNGYNDIVARQGLCISNQDEVSNRNDVVMKRIVLNGDVLAYLVVMKNNDNEKIEIATNVLREFLADEFYFA